MEPQSLADPSRAQVRQARSRLGMRLESVADAADRLRDDVWIASVREAAQPAGGDLLIAAPTRDVGRDQRHA